MNPEINPEKHNTNSDQRDLERCPIMDPSSGITAVELVTRVLERASLLRSVRLAENLQIPSGHPEAELSK